MKLPVTRRGKASGDCSEEQPREEGRFADVTIKRGDALEKIARANGTTVEAIMKANNSKNDRLRIGQILKVPVGDNKRTSTNAKAPSVTSKQVALADVKGQVNITSQERERP